jgi:hypothetical protein
MSDKRTLRNDSELELCEREREPLVRALLWRVSKPRPTELLPADVGLCDEIRSTYADYARKNDVDDENALYKLSSILHCDAVDPVNILHLARYVLQQLAESLQAAEKDFEKAVRVGHELAQHFRKLADAIESACKPAETQ